MPDSPRMQAIDAARGIAMILVCVSHVRIHFADAAPTLYFILTSITRIATPTFLLLSGFVAAYVLANGGRNMRLTLVDRGLFVLLTGHFLLSLSELRSVALDEWILGRVTVTDAIGVCLICAVVLHRLPARILAVLGGAIVLASWPIAMTQTFTTPLLRYVGAVLFDLRSEANPLIDAAIVPYLGVFLVGMSLSKSSLADLRQGTFARVARRLAAWGIAALGVVALAVGGWFLLKFLDLTPTDPALSELARRALDPRSKLPPGPSYLLFYCGCGLLITAGCLIAKPRTLMKPLINWTSTIGRASLMCFILQDWLLILLPSLLRFENEPSLVFWTAYLVVVVVFMRWVASRWDAAGANRFLTLGLRKLGQTRRPHAT